MTNMHEELFKMNLGQFSIKISATGYFSKCALPDIFYKFTKLFDF